MRTGLLLPVRRRRPRFFRRAPGVRIPGRRPGSLLPQFVGFLRGRRSGWAVTGAAHPTLGWRGVDFEPSDDFGGGSERSRPALVFVVPAHGRTELARVCLRQLARTCTELTENGLDATAVVVACDENLETARALGFEALDRPNQPLGKRWNDGYEHAARLGADYLVPLGSDDWLDPDLLLRQKLPAPGELLCFRDSAVVREDGRELATLHIRYPGGDGVRVIATETLAPLRFRPAEDTRRRAIDTSILQRLTVALGREPTLRYGDVHALQVVDWKSPANLNGYTACLHFRKGPLLDPWRALRGVYPAVALDEIQTVYGRVPVLV